VCTCVCVCVCLYVCVEVAVMHCLYPPPPYNTLCNTHCNTLCSSQLTHPDACVSLPPSLQHALPDILRHTTQKTLIPVLSSPIPPLPTCPFSECKQVENCAHDTYTHTKIYTYKHAHTHKYRHTYRHTNTCTHTRTDVQIELFLCKDVETKTIQ